MSANPDLVIATVTDTDSTAVWVLEPQGRSTFCIVVRCRPYQRASAAPVAGERFLGTLARHMTRPFSGWRVTRQKDVGLKEAV